MSEFLLNNYLWVQAFHLIAVISWMAGMLYLPRLYVYHAKSIVGSDQSETFKIMENRLLRYIMNPAMILTFIFGGLMIWANPGLFSSGWIHAKILLVVLLAAAHMVFSKWRKDFAKDQNTKSPKFFKIANEIPTVLMILIVILAVVKPF